MKKGNNKALAKAVMARRLLNFKGKQEEDGE
jgi:hypothetical protein